MKTTIEEIFEQMKLRLCEVVDRVFDTLFSNFNTLELVELKSSGKLHNPDKVDALSDFSKSPAESNWSNDFHSKGVPSLIQEPSNEDETTESGLSAMKNQTSLQNW